MFDATSVPSFTAAFYHLLQTPTRGAGPAGREECVRGESPISVSATLLAGDVRNQGLRQHSKFSSVDLLF